MHQSPAAKKNSYSKETEEKNMDLNWWRNECGSSTRGGSRPQQDEDDEHQERDGMNAGHCLPCGWLRRLLHRRVLLAPMLQFQVDVSVHPWTYVYGDDTFRRTRNRCTTLRSRFEIILHTQVHSPAPRPLHLHQTPTYCKQKGCKSRISVRKLQPNMNPFATAQKQTGGLS